MSIILLLACLSCAALAYELNDIENNALECIRNMFGSGSTKMGDLRISCREDYKQRLMFSEILTGTGARHNGLRVGGKCKSKGGIACATKLLSAQCGEIISGLQDNLVDELIKAVQPKDHQACVPPYVLTKLEERALECISQIVTSNKEQKNGLAVTCERGRFAQLAAAAFGGARTPLMEQGTTECKLGTFTGKAVRTKAAECAKLMMETACGFTTANHNSVGGGVEKLIDTLSLTEKRVCGKDL